MESVRKDVFKYLENNPKANNENLYDAFPNYNKSSIRIYKKQFFENYDKDITIKIEKDVVILETFLTDLSFLPVLFFVKLYWKIKEIEVQGIEDFSVVDIYQDIFKDCFLRIDKLNEMYEFSYNLYQRVGEVYADINNDTFTPITEEKYKKLIMKKIWKSAYLCSEILMKLSGYIFEDDSGDPINFKETEKRNVINDAIRYVEAYILGDYIILDFYESVPFLRNREKKDKFIDFKKVDFLTYKASRINGKFVYSSWHYDEKYSNISKHYDLKDFKESEGKIGFSYDFEDDIYLEYVEKEDVDPDEWNWMQKRKELNKEIQKKNELSKKAKNDF